MAQKPETKFRQNSVLPFLKTLRNTFYEPIQQVAIHGSSDFHLSVHGRFVALELKSAKCLPGGIQLYKLNEVLRTGGLAIVARPDNWVEVKNLLSEMDSSKEIAWKTKGQLSRTSKSEGLNSHK